MLQLKKKRPHEVDIVNQHKKLLNLKLISMKLTWMLTYLQVICVTVLLRRGKRLCDLWIIVSLRLNSSFNPKPNNTENKKHSSTKKRSRNCHSNMFILLPSAFLYSMRLPSILCVYYCRTWSNINTVGAVDWSPRYSRCDVFLV